MAPIPNFNELYKNCKNICFYHHKFTNFTDVTKLKIRKMLDTENCNLRCSELFKVYCQVGMTFVKTLEVVRLLSTIWPWTPVINRRLIVNILIVKTWQTSPQYFCLDVLVFCLGPWLLYSWTLLMVLVIPISIFVFTKMKSTSM